MATPDTEPSMAQNAPALSNEYDKTVKKCTESVKELEEVFELETKLSVETVDKVCEVSSYTIYSYGEISRISSKDAATVSILHQQMLNTLKDALKTLALLSGRALSETIEPDIFNDDLKKQFQMTFQGPYAEIAQLNLNRICLARNYSLWARNPSAQNKSRLRFTIKNLSMKEYIPALIMALFDDDVQVCTKLIEKYSDTPNNLKVFENGKLDQQGLKLFREYKEVVYSCAYVDMRGNALYDSFFDSLWMVLDATNKSLSEYFASRNPVLGKWFSFHGNAFYLPLLINRVNRLYVTVELGIACFDLLNASENNFKEMKDELYQLIAENPLKDSIPIQTMEETIAECRPKILERRCLDSLRALPESYKENVPLKVIPNLNSIAKDCLHASEAKEEYAESLQESAERLATIFTCFVSKNDTGKEFSEQLLQAMNSAYTRDCHADTFKILKHTSTFSMLIYSYIMAVKADPNAMAELKNQIINFPVRILAKIKYAPFSLDIEADFKKESKILEEMLNDSDVDKEELKNSRERVALLAHALQQELKDSLEYSPNAVQESNEKLDILEACIIKLFDSISDFEDILSTVNDDIELRDSPNDSWKKDFSLFYNLKKLNI